MVNCNYSINGASHLYGILNDVDFVDLVFSIAPYASLHLQYSMDDLYFDYKNADNFVKRLEKNFLKYNISSKLETKITNMGHGSDINAIADFFHSTIK